jgi:hypothetical protein
LAAPTEEDAELPSEVPAIPCRGEPPPFVRSALTREGNATSSARSCRYSSSSAAHLAGEESDTERCGTRSSEGTAATSTTPCRISTELATNLRRFKMDTSEDHRRYRSVGSANLRRMRSYPRRCPPIPCRGEPPPFVRSGADARG